MPKILPEILKEHILPFDWDVRRVWALDAAVIQIPCSKFVYLLKLPLWSSVPKRGLLFDVCPVDIINDPNISAYQTQRLHNADIQYPIDILFTKDKQWVLDGVHRIAKHVMLNKATFPARLHDESVIPVIKLGTSCADA